MNTASLVSRPCWDTCQALWNADTQTFFDVGNWLLLQTLSEEQLLERVVVGKCLRNGVGADGEHPKDVPLCEAVTWPLDELLTAMALGDTNNPADDAPDTESEITRSLACRAELEAAYREFSGDGGCHARGVAMLFSLIEHGSSDIFYMAEPLDLVVYAQVVLKTPEIVSLFKWRGRVQVANFQPYSNEDVVVGYAKGDCSLTTHVVKATAVLQRFQEDLRPLHDSLLHWANVHGVRAFAEPLCASLLDLDPRTEGAVPELSRVLVSMENLAGSYSLQSVEVTTNGESPFSVAVGIIDNDDDSGDDDSGDGGGDDDDDDSQHHGMFL